jgi:hypothetical protein
VETSPDEWVQFLSADVEGRRRWLRKRRAKGARQRLDELATAFGAAHGASGVPAPEPRLRERETLLHRDRRRKLSGRRS